MVVGPQADLAPMLQRRPVMRVPVALVLGMLLAQASCIGRGSTQARKRAYVGNAVIMASGVGAFTGAAAAAERGADGAIFPAYPVMIISIVAGVAGIVATASDRSDATPALTTPALTPTAPPSTSQPATVTPW
jgi:hypothetical protein